MSRIVDEPGRAARRGCSADRDPRREYHRRLLRNAAARRSHATAGSTPATSAGRGGQLGHRPHQGLIIIRGPNFYPQDIERLAQQVADVNQNRVAAAGVRLPGEESEGLAVFVLHRGELEGFVAKAQGIRRAIAEQTGVEVGAVVPVSQIPKTTSGKLQRYLLARAFEQGEFSAVLARLAPLLGARPIWASGRIGRSRARRWGRLEAICSTCCTGPTHGAEDNLLDTSLDSLTLARLHEAIDREFPHRIEVSDLFEYPTLADSWHGSWMRLRA